MTLEQAEKVWSLLKELHNIERCKDAFNASFGYSIKYDNPKDCFCVDLPPYIIMEFGKEQIIGQLDKRICEIKKEIDEM